MRKAVLALIFAFAFTPLTAQNYSVSSSDGEIVVSGTSTIHDWEAPAEEFSGTATIQIEEGRIASIDKLTLSVVVDGINSGKGGMDKKIYDALNEKKYPNISFTLTNVSAIEDETVLANGNLTIAGVTKPVQLQVEYQILPDGAVVFKGSYPIKMTDYKVDPPTAMLGTIKAGNEVTVAFDMAWTCSGEQLACSEIN